MDIMPEMQKWNLNQCRTIPYICYKGARGKDAEPIICREISNCRLILLPCCHSPSPNIDFETIKKANAGDTTAMQKLLAHYNVYIMFFSKYHGAVNYVHAEEIRAKLMKAVLEFKIDR